MWWQKEVVLHEVMKGAVVVLVVDAKMNDELMTRGDGLKGKGVNPGEGVWSLGAADMSIGGNGVPSIGGRGESKRWGDDM